MKATTRFYVVIAAALFLVSTASADSFMDKYRHLFGEKYNRGLEESERSRNKERRDNAIVDTEAKVIDDANANAASSQPAETVDSQDRAHEREETIGVQSKSFSGASRPKYNWDEQRRKIREAARDTGDNIVETRDASFNDSQYYDSARTEGSSGPARRREEKRHVPFKSFTGRSAYVGHHATYDDASDSSAVNPDSDNPSDNDDIVQNTRNRNLAYGNHHRNQIATLDSNHPLLPPTDHTVSTGLFHTCAITKRTGVDEDTCGKRACGPVKCWGHNESGQSTPPPAMFAQVSAGGYFTCGIKVGGDVVCWGEIDKVLKSKNHLDGAAAASETHVHRDSKYERRLDKSEYKDEIQRRKNMAQEQYKQSLYSPNGGAKHIQVSSGMKHACAISRDLAVHCWGRNDFGESSPPDGKFVQISAGNSFTCGLRSNGAVECWGKNSVGQSTPPPRKYFKQISASIVGEHACGIDEDSIICWGNNMRGQSEHQDGSFVHVSPGMRTTCAIRDDRAAFTHKGIHCWGGRASELIDQIKRDDDTRPMREYNKLYHQILLGQDHACAIATFDKRKDETTASSTLQCWWMAGSHHDAHRVPVGLEIV